MTTITDETLARRLLERAIANTSKPALDTATVDDLVTLATVTDPDTSAVSFTSASLNIAASVAWNWKAALTADVYDLGGGDGKYLKRDQWFEHCTTMSKAYGSGSMSVLDGGDGGRPAGGIVSLPVISSTAGYGS